MENKQKHKVGDNNLTMYVDAANPEIWSSLKRMLNEPYSEQYVFEKLSYYKKNNINPANHMKVIPVPFSTKGAKMLQHAESLLEDLVAIDKRFRGINGSNFRRNSLIHRSKKAHRSCIELNIRLRTLEESL